jgi:hypothetical protein
MLHHAMRRVVAGAGGAGPATFATLDPLNKATSIDLSNGNLTATKTTSTAFKSAIATVSKSSGKFYCEMTIHQSAVNYFLGVCPIDFNVETFLGTTATSWGYHLKSAQKWTNNVGAAGGASIQTANDVIGMAVDLNAGYIWWRDNGVWLQSGNPDAGTNPQFTGLTGLTLAPAMSIFNDTTSSTMNFGATAYADAAPSGFGDWTS